jgi:serine/threonine-protein kinase
MTRRASDLDRALPLDVLERIDRICDRFEEAWRQGDRPRLEDYLDGVAEEHRLALQHHLLAAEIDCRRDLGETPVAADYQERFPEQAAHLSTLLPLPAGSSVLKALGAGLPTVPRVQLRQPPEETATPVHLPNSPEMPDEPGPAGGVGRLQLHGEIARGGMGAILKGRDIDLGRDLAVKVLLETHAGRTELIQRFVEEAQISGQLQHPGIAPVFELGQFADRRPYFTMKLVKGQTLAALLAVRTDPAQDRPRLLGVFAQVCQTLAYAHARGVIHRDLKPSNVMVGAFGEVLVMDWGLAKVLRQGGVADEARAQQQQRSVIRTHRSERLGTPEGLDSHTAAGSVLGTPAYMAPEQARGDVELVDERADVFGLGAMLCVILTGQPPFTGTSAEAQRKAQTAQLAEAEARLVACGAEAELVLLARRCLAAEPWERPRHAGLVAEAVLAYQHSVTERLRQAELARVAEEVRVQEAQATAAQERRAREEAEGRATAERRARRLTAALAASVLVTMLLGGGGWLGLRLQGEARQARLNDQVNEALNQATALRERAKAAHGQAARSLATQAREQAQRAQALLDSGSAEATLVAKVQTVLGELEQEEKDHQLLAALDMARMAQVENAAGENRFALERALPLYREALRVYGLPVGEGEARAVAARIGKCPLEVREALLATLDEWLALAADPKYQIAEPQQRWLESVMAQADPGGWSAHIQQAAAEPDQARRRAALEQLTAADNVRRLPAVALTRLAERLQLVQAHASALRLLRWAQQRYPGDFWVNEKLGKALGDQKLPLLEEEVRYLTAAVALRPESGGAHYNLGHALSEQGKLDEAIAAYRRALDLDPKDAAAHINLGAALDKLGKLDEAMAAFRIALDLDPKHVLAHYNLGLVLSEQGKLDEAIAAYRRALDLDPKHAAAHTNLGNALARQGKLDEAIAALRQALALDPKDALAHYNLGHALSEQGKLDEAIAAYRRALDLDPKHARAHYNLGVVLSKQGKLGEAITAYRRALDLDPMDAVAHYNLGLALSKQGKPDEAIAAYRRALALDPKDARAHSDLGAELCDVKHDYAGAIACFRKAIELDPKYAIAHKNLGIALSKQGKLDEAVAAYRRAIALEPKYAKAYISLGIDLEKQGKPDEAIAAYRKAIELKPDDAEAHCNLGGVLLKHGRLAEALVSRKRGHELGSKRADWKYPSADWVKETETLLRVESQLPAILRGDLEAGSADDLFAYGKHLQEQKRWPEAAAILRQVIRLQPDRADAHAYLAWYLERQGDLDGATAAGREAIRLNPKISWYHNNLGYALQRQGHLRQAADEYREALRLDPKHDQALANLRYVEPFLQAEARLPLILKGDVRPADNAERLDLARVCHFKRMYHTAVRFSTEALRAEPALAEKVEAWHRYNVACYSALSGCGQGVDAPPDGPARARLRQQALDLLRADLALSTKQLESGKAPARQVVQDRLRHWQQDSDLAGLRDDAGLAKLPAAEQEACRKLWADVQALLKQIADKK